MEDLGGDRLFASSKANSNSVIANIKDLEATRSGELKRLRAQVEASVYDKQTWARQGDAMEMQIKKLGKKLELDQQYTSALEDCCSSAGFPVSKDLTVTVTEPIVGFQPVIIHTMRTPVRMLLQGKIKGVSSQRLARWLADIQAREITINNTRILPHLLGDIEGHPHTCESEPEAQSLVHDQPLPGQLAVYIDGSRYCQDGNFFTGCAVWAPHLSESDVRQQLLLKLPAHMSAQEAELIALLEAIRAYPEPLCIYTDSRYVFGIANFMAQWQLRKFLTSAGTPVSHYNTIPAIW